MVGKGVSFVGFALNRRYSALVGLATMLITLPVPGWITKNIQGTQREKMRRVRLCCVFVSCNIVLILHG